MRDVEDASSTAEGYEEKGKGELKKKN